MLNILITGANGQLGSELRRLGAASRHRYVYTDAAELDITSEEAVRRTIRDERIDAIVNCAAYTNVDRAEEDEATADLLNHRAVAILAGAAKEYGATLIHISTDYVFRGNGNTPAAKRSRPTRWACTGGRSSQVKRRCRHQDANT